LGSWPPLRSDVGQHAEDDRRKDDSEHKPERVHDRLEASLRRFGLHVTRLEGSVPARRANPFRESAPAVAAGRSKATPFVLFVAVNVALVVLAALIALVVLLVLRFL
jgi:hypothetical protein